MKRLYISSLLFFFPILIFCQQAKQGNTLLWRISGKGLTKPSYLFGTIHLTDKKVFFLGDSVYNAIERSEGFAAELDLNSIGMEMINQFMKEEEDKKATEPVKVKDVVSPEIWQRYKKSLAETFGKKAENVTIEDLDEMKAALESEMFKKGDMPTFLDAYLFGIAKKQGKWVGGIEDLDDQIEHINDFESVEEKIQTALYDEDYYRGGLSWMVKMYNGQQLDSIDALMYREESGHKDHIMIKRNLKMARRMDSLSAIRNTFFAVGAAHLPGDSGVITLLRARGFVVTPVISTKKIDPSKYIVKSSDEAWFAVDIKDSAYFLKMPGTASSFEMLESYGINTKVFFDISFMKLFMTMTIELPGDRKKLGADSLYGLLKKQYAERGTDVKEKTISINGVGGRELRFKTKDGDFIIQVFLPGMERMVLNVVMALKEQSNLDDENKKFFQSFIVNTNPKKSIKEELKWYSYSNQTQSFSLDFPGKPNENKDVRSEEGKIIHTFMSVDMSSQVFYGLRISGVKEGLHIPMVDSVHLQLLGEDIRAKFEKATITDSSLFTFNNFPACRISASAINEGDEISIDILSVLRGNKNYYLFVFYQPGENGAANSAKFLNSFKLLPINYPTWKTQHSNENNFSTTSPFPFRPYKPSEEEEEAYMNVKRVMMYDTLASHTLFVDRAIIPSWYWYQSDTAFLRTWANKHLEYGDSLADYTVKNVGKRKTVEFFIFKPGQVTVKKVKFILQGNEIYEVFGTLARQDIDQSYYKFFDDFKISKEPLSFEIARPKFNELKEVIKAGSKNQIKEIIWWWDVIDFAEPDLNGLQSLMFKPYPDLDSNYGISLNWKIIQRIQMLDTSHNTIDIILNNYKNITGENNKVKPLLVSYLSRIQTERSFNLIKQILREASYPADINIDYYLAFYDSLELTATLFPEILKLTASDHLVGQICGVTTSLIDEDILKKDVLRSHEKHFTSLASKVTKEKGKDEQVYNYYDLVRILGILNTPESNKSLVQFSKYSDREMRYQTLLAMLKNKLPVDSKTIYTLASTDEYRYNLFEELRKLKKLSLFPPDYLSQEKIAYSKLVTDLNDEDYPNVFIKAGNKTITYKGKQQKVYLYKVYESDSYDYLTDKDGPTYYMAVAGPYSMNTKDCYSTHELTGIFWDEEFDEKKLDELIKKYIDSIKEE